MRTKTKYLFIVREKLLSMALQTSLPFDSSRKLSGQAVANEAQWALVFPLRCNLVMGR